MDPEAIRRCMSFGFSDKKSKSAIGRCTFYSIIIQPSTLILQMIWLTLSLSDGNGFKTSTMRLGADVIVFSRQSDNRCVYCLIGVSYLPNMCVLQIEMEVNAPSQYPLTFRCFGVSYPFSGCIMSKLEYEHPNSSKSF